MQNADGKSGDAQKMSEGWRVITINKSSSIYFHQHSLCTVVCPKNLIENFQINQMEPNNLHLITNKYKRIFDRPCDLEAGWKLERLSKKASLVVKLFKLAEKCAGAALNVKDKFTASFTVLVVPSDHIFNDQLQIGS